MGLSIFAANRPAQAFWPMAIASAGGRSVERFDHQGNTVLRFVNRIWRADPRASDFAMCDRSKQPSPLVGAVLAVQRFSGAIPLIRALKAAMSSLPYERWTRLADAGRLASGVPGPPFGRRPDGARGEAAAAVGADIVEILRNALCAKGALVRTNPRERGVRRQIPVAPLAIKKQWFFGIIWNLCLNQSHPSSNIVHRVFMKSS